MNRCLILLFLAAMFLSCMFFPPPLSAGDADQDIIINTPEQAAEHAAKLANERSLNAFGKTPFTSQSYSPRRIGTRWHWGKIEPPGICGYSAEVEFNTDGSDPKVRAVLHTDQMSIRELNPVRVPFIEEPPLSPDETGDNHQ